MSVAKTPGPATGATTKTDWAEAPAASTSARAKVVRVVDMGVLGSAVVLRRRRRPISPCAGRGGQRSHGRLYWAGPRAHAIRAGGGVLDVLLAFASDLSREPLAPRRPSGHHSRGGGRLGEARGRLGLRPQNGSLLGGRAIQVRREAITSFASWKEE